MAPVRRYLRITKYSVIECRIYLDNPALAQSWLLNPRNPVLPRVIESVRPLVLPKLREERERSRKRSTKKKGIKDVVTEDDFEVSIFLTETPTRHSLLTKQKHFHDTTQTKLTSNSGRLIGATNEAPIDVDAADLEAGTFTVIRDEDDEEDAVALAAIPAAVRDESHTAASRRPKRQRRQPGKSSRRQGAGANLSHAMDDEDEDGEDEDGDYHDPEDYEGGGGSDEDDLEEQDSDFEVVAARETASARPDATRGPPPAKRRKEAAEDDMSEGGAGQHDDKKKLAMDISYEGFSIYGRVLCLVVKRRELTAAGAAATRGGRAGVSNNTTTTTTASNSGSRVSKPGTTPGAGQGMMEDWIASTQMPAGEEAAA